jgi:hypothetical protein
MLLRARSDSKRHISTIQRTIIRTMRHQLWRARLLMAMQHICERKSGPIDYSASAASR